MAHNIDMSNGRANIAFIGSRRDIWHRLGTEMKPGQSIETWAKAAGLDWSAVKVPAIVHLKGAEFDHIDASKRFAPVDGWNHIVRSDNGAPLGYVSDQYQPVQPSDVLAWFDRYISVDPRFQLDVAGSLKGGQIIWATATFREKVEVAGSDHVARVLMSTTFDGSGATTNRGTMTRVVCNNTLDVANADNRAVIRTRHNTPFNAAKVGKDLAAVAKGFHYFAACGNAMEMVEMSGEDISRFFKAVLDIPFDTDKKDISTRKLNQFDALREAYGATVQEGTKKNTVWTALNAITRYVDHDRATRNTEATADHSRFASAQFGSGQDMKAKAWNLLLPTIKDKVPVAA
ncbi:MAG: DUF932 domain-containing protein [Rhizobiales bacterium]|nr:DUF932 domain-containing protein [Hyphomicrobiales bacterium]